MPCVTVSRVTGWRETNNAAAVAAELGHESSVRTPTGPTAATPIGEMAERRGHSATSTSRSPITRPGSKIADGSRPSGCAAARRRRRDQPLVRDVAPPPGIEVDITEDGTLDQEPKAILAELDVVVASVHSKLRAWTPRRG